MSDKKQDVNVVFSHPWELLGPDTEDIVIGTIPADVAKKIDIILKQHPGELCPYFRRFRVFPHDALKNMIKLDESKLKFKYMFGEVYNATEFTNPPACMAGTNLLTSRQMFFNCKKHLSTGKCKNELMRRTVGVALFPQLYAAKQNVKGK